MLRQVLGYPLRNGGKERLLLGWILHLVHALLVPVVPLVYVLGYLLSVIDSARRGDPAPDPWDWRSVLRDGGRGIVVIVAYGAIPALVLLFGYLLLPRDTGDFALFLVAAITSMTVFLAIPPLYLLPIGLSRVADSGSIWSAFDRTPILGTARAASYLVWWSVGAVLVATGLWLAGFLGQYLIGYLGAFYCEVGACYAFGRGCRSG